MTKLSVIIVSYKVRDLVVDCLQSVFAAAGSVQLEVFLVDNASNDGTVEQVRREFPSVQVIANQQNLGFPKGNNQAWATCTGDVVLLLNPDTIMDVNALDALGQFFDQQSEGAVVGLNVRNSDGTFQSCVHELPNFRSLVFSILRLDRTFPRSLFFNSYGYGGVELSEVRAVGYVSGSALALNRGAFQKLGGLDENLFWWEDVDVCCRAWKMDLPVYFLPTARVMHLVGQSAKKNLRRVLYHQHSGRVRYFRKHFNGTIAGIVAIITLAELCGKALIRAVQCVVPSRRREIILRMAGYLDAVNYIVLGRVQKAEVAQ